MDGSPADLWYVTTDDEGVEHGPTGPVAWVLPTQDGPQVTEATGHRLVLRRPESLLDGLDERVWRAEISAGGRPGATTTDRATTDRATTDRATTVSEARLVGAAHWDLQSASEFACSCAEHVLGSAAGVTLPGGMTLARVLDECRRALGGTAAGEHQGLGHLATLAALHRLRRVRRELTGLEAEILVDDSRREVELDALDDPDYETVAPIVHAVLAAVEALRHHLLPNLYMREADRVEAREEALVLEGKDHALERAPLLVETPFGAFDAGPPVLTFEPAWACATAAARDARLAARDESGPAAERAERAWQAHLLGQVLEQGRWEQSMPRSPSGSREESPAG